MKTAIIFFLLLSLIFVSCDKNNPVNSNESGFLAKPGPILFVSDKSGTTQLYSMNEDGSNAQQLTNDKNFPITDARWSPDGSRIALVSPVGGVPFYGAAIYIVNADGTEKYLLTKSNITVQDSTLGNIIYQGTIGIIWSPDGKKIAYSRLMVPEVYDNRDIFIINADGSNEIRITKTIGLSETINDWFHKSEYLLISVGDTSITSKVLKLSLLNGDENLISNLYNSSNAKISKNDNFILFTAWTDNSKRFEIYKCDIDGNNKVIIPTTTNTFNWVAAISPDNNSFIINSANSFIINSALKIYLKNTKTNKLVILPLKDFEGDHNYATSWR